MESKGQTVSTRSSARFCSRAPLVMLVAVIAVLAAWAMPLEPAYAGWPLESAGSVLLGFGGSYEATVGAISTHRGTDVAATQGDRVIAPLAGTVTFAGRVPATGGGTCGAVTISTDQGSLTLLPLVSITVVRGDRLSPDSAVGVLAAGGDNSSSATHLHVGLRRGDLYVDPLSALAAPQVQRDSPSEPRPDPVVEPAGHTAPVGAAGARPDRSGAPSPRAHVAGAPAPISVPVRAPAAGEQLAAGVSVAGGPVTTVAGASVAAVGIEALPGELGAVVRAESRASRADEAAARASSLAARFARWSAGASRVAGLGAAGALLALGLLWPVWRRSAGEGSGELLVRDLSEDVAAAVGR